jgi:predicted MPP superfamily phosphohydrolase
VDLQLSGHTHGAQMWPFEYIIALGQPLLAGLGEFRDTVIAGQGGRPLAPANNHWAPIGSP